MQKFEVSCLYTSRTCPFVAHKNKSVDIKTPSVIIHPRYTTIKDINDCYKSLRSGPWETEC